MEVEGCHTAHGRTSALSIPGNSRYNPLEFRVLGLVQNLDLRESPSFNVDLQEVQKQNRRKGVLLLYW